MASSEIIPPIIPTSSVIIPPIEVTSSAIDPPIYSTDILSLSTAMASPEISSSSMAMPPTTSDVAVESSTPGPDTYSTTESVPALPTEESIPAPTLIIASSTILPPIYSETPSIAPVFSTTPLPETYPTTTSIPEVFSSTPLPDPIFSSTLVPEVYPTTTTADATPSSTSALILTSPIRCDFGEDAETVQDDANCEIILPQPMVVYGKSSVNTYASTNGFLSIIDGATQYQNDGELPTTQVTEADNETPLSALFPFWNDLSKPEGLNDYGIYYQLSETGVTYEFYLSRPEQDNVYHWTVDYAYANPGVFSFDYFEMEDPGDLATVGAQGCEYPLLPSILC